MLRPSFDELTQLRPTTAETSWTLITHQGKRSIGAGEYTAVVAHPEQFDLFLDAVAPGNSRAYMGGYRDPNGRFHHVTLSALQMRVLTELVSRAVPLRPRELRSVQTAGTQNPAKIVDGARKAVDVRLSRYSWRSFHTLPGESPDQRRYMFRPPQSLRCACIHAGEPANSA